MLSEKVIDRKIVEIMSAASPQLTQAGLLTALNDWSLPLGARINQQDLSAALARLAKEGERQKNLDKKILDALSRTKSDIAEGALLSELNKGSEEVTAEELRIALDRLTKKGMIRGELS